MELADREAKHLRGLEVDHELELGRLHDRQVGWLLALENTPGVEADLAIGVGDAGPVAHQTASHGELAPFVDRGNGVACGQRDDLVALVVEVRVRANEQPSGSQ